MARSTILRNLLTSIRKPSLSDKSVLLVTTNQLVVSSGGQEVLIDQGGVDATAAFEEVGHSDAARELLASLQIGVLRSQVAFHLAVPTYILNWQLMLGKA